MPRRRPIRTRTNRSGAGLDAAEAAARAEAEADSQEPAGQSTPEATGAPATEPLAGPEAEPVEPASWPAVEADAEPVIEPAPEPVPIEPVHRPGSSAPVAAAPGADPMSLDATAPYPVATQPRRRRGRWLVPFLAIVVVLLLAAGSGYGLAFLVASLANVTPPTVTLPPATATPSPLTPQPSSAAPSASPSTPGASASASPIPSQAIHVVQRGEYLTQIAARYGVSPQRLAEVNDIENPNLIEPGQQLIIPPPE